MLLVRKASGGNPKRHDIPSTRSIESVPLPTCIEYPEQPTPNQGPANRPRSGLVLLPLMDPRQRAHGVSHQSRYAVQDGGPCWVNEEAMLYVFNSGFRNKYRSNLLTGLAAPPRSPYKVSYGKARNVSDKALAALAGIKAGDPVLLVFIDRYSEGPYQYVPVRRATYLRHHLDAGRVDIELLLAEWPELAPGQDFTQWVTETLAPLGAPQKVAGDGVEDGDYAVVGPDLPARMFSGGDGWESIARALAEKQSLKDRNDERVVFARLDLQDSTDLTRTMRWSQQAASRAESAYRKLFGKPARSMRFNGGRTYTARVTYLFPAQRADTNAQVPYRLHLEGGLSPITRLTDSVSAEHRADTFEFLAPPLASGPCSVGLTFGDSEKVVAPRLDIVAEFAWSPVLAFVGIGLGALWVAAREALK
jgi:hypothetical protein